MSFKQELQAELRLPPRLAAKLPAGYQKIGSICLLRLHPALRRLEPHIVAAIRKSHRFTAIVSQRAVAGEFRKPAVRLLWGRSTRTLHKEHGCTFAIDVRKAMFSKGNVSERHRLRVRKGEVIADFFAGIGYFAVPLAKQGAIVYAVEKNPEAIELLRENIARNRVRVLPILSDCRRAALPERVDRVVLGYFPGTERFLPAAFRACKRRAIIHFHNSYRAAELWKLPEQQLRAAASTAGFRVERIERHVVKSLSPSLRHVVLDATVRSR